MAKNKERWQRVSAYDLVKKKLVGQATSDELEAANAYLEIMRAGGKAQVFNVAGKLVVR